MRDVERQVVLTGTFDVRNYGDLLFPLLAAHRLAPHGITVRPASPTGRETGWKDAVPTEQMSAALDSPQKIDGILIGGGNIIHAQPVTLPDYVETGVAERAYGGLWLDATLAAARRGVPVMWNAPGVPYSFDDEMKPILQAALRAASHVAVRDEESAAFLAPFKPHVVPDTAIGLASLWPRQSLEPAYRHLLEKSGADPQARFIALHVKARSVKGPPESIAPLIDAFSEATGCQPLLMALGQCHDDHVATTKICAALQRPRIDLSYPVGLREIAAAIAFSQGYVGASMHGYVTAAAYRVPGIIVGRPALPKMRGLLAHLNRPRDEVSDWTAGFDAMITRMRTLCEPVPKQAFENLDAHWGVVAKTLGTCRFNEASHKLFFEMRKRAHT